MTDQETPEGGALPSDANASQATPQTDVVQEQPGSEATPSVAADPSEPAKPKESGEAIRIKELTRRLREEERRSERLLARLEERQSPAPQPKPAEPPKTLRDFNGDEGAFTAYLEDRVAKTADRVVEARLTEAQKRQLSQQRTTSFRAREAEYAKTVEDYAEVAHYAPISSEVAELVKTLERGPEVAYHLGKNHELAERLRAMPPVEAAIEIGRIEARLSKPVPKSVSQAPPPTPKIGAAEPGVADDVPNDSWSDAKFRKWREKQIAQRK